MKWRKKFSNRLESSSASRSRSAESRYFQVASFGRPALCFDLVFGVKRRIARERLRFTFCILSAEFFSFDGTPLVFFFLIFVPFLSSPSAKLIGPRVVRASGNCVDANASSNS